MLRQPLTCQFIISPLATSHFSNISYHKQAPLKIVTKTHSCIISP